MKGAGQLPCSEAPQAPLSCSSKLPPALCPQGEVRTWEFSYLCRAGCVLCCVPPRFPSSVMSLQISAGDCSAALRPSLGGRCFVGQAPGPVAGLPVSLAFSAAPGPRILGRPVPADSGVKRRGEFLPSAFPPILCVEAAVGSQPGRGPRGTQCPAWPSGALCRRAGRTGLTSTAVRGAVRKPGLGGHGSSALRCGQGL